MGIADSLHAHLNTTNYFLSIFTAVTHTFVPCQEVGQSKLQIPIYNGFSFIREFKGKLFLQVSKLNILDWMFFENIEIEDIKMFKKQQNLRNINIILEGKKN